MLASPMHAFDVIALTLTANGGKIAGRTTLQKLIYFETVTIPKIKLSEPYVPYFYGPFNRDVARSLEDMVFYGILDERRTLENNAGYEYEVTPKGTKVTGRLESEFEGVFSEIKTLVDKCKQHCKLNPQSMSFAAKVHYMLGTKTTKPLSEDDLVKMGKSFDWKISKSDIKRGAKLLEQLHLVKINR